MEARRLGGLFDGETKHQAGSVWDKNLIAPTIDTMQGGCREPMIIEYAQAIRMVRTEEGKALRKEYESGAIHHGFNEHREMELRTDGVSNTLSTVQKDNYICEKFIVAMRGRNPENPSDRTVGLPTEQRLEPNSQGICNTLTSVQKDNLVLENCIDLYNKNIRQDKCVGTLTTNSGTQFHCGSMGIVETISTKGKQIEVASTILAGYERTNMTGFNSDNGVIEKVLGVTLFESDGFGGWKVNKEELSPTIRAEKVCAGALETGIPQYRIRKLTPLECWRLMDFTDEDFEKAAQVNSNTQLYKQAGNSIVKNVLVAIIGQMLPGKEDVYKKLETR